jgi:hypothetical protein
MKISMGLTEALARFAYVQTHPAETSDADRQKVPGAQPTRRIGGANPSCLVPAAHGRSRQISAAKHGGRGRPSPVRNSVRRSAAFGHIGMKSRMPWAIRRPLMRLTWTVRSVIKRSRSRFWRRQSSSSTEGTCTARPCGARRALGPPAPGVVRRRRYGRF